MKPVLLGELYAPSPKGLLSAQIFDGIDGMYQADKPFALIDLAYTQTYECVFGDVVEKLSMRNGL